MTSFRLLILVLLLVHSIGTSWACSCDWGGPFFKVATESEVILEGTVGSYESEDQSLILNVTGVLKGEEPRSSVRIWGDNGALCRPYVYQFPIKSSWIFSLYRVSPEVGEGISFDNSDENEEKIDYAVSFCGEFALRVVGETAVGKIETNSVYEDDEMPAANVRNRVSTWNE